MHAFWLICTVAEKCDENIKHHAILEIPKAKIDGNYTLDIGDEPAVHAFSAKTLTDVCAKDKTLWNIYLVA